MVVVVQREGLLMSSVYYVIRILGHLGSGQFGTVNRGLYNHSSVKREVALKTLNKGTSKEDTIKFLQEAAIMAQFYHPNIIKLHGIVNGNESVNDNEPVIT